MKIILKFINILHIIANKTNIMIKLNKIQHYIVLWLSIILLIWSFIYLYNKSNIDVDIKNKNLYQANQILKDQVKKSNVKLKNIKEGSEIKKKNIDKNLLIKNILNLSNKTKRANLRECYDTSLSKKEQETCKENFFFHKYTQLLNSKWIIDKRLCEDIKNKFWEDTYLYRRCSFIYIVDSGTKYLNVKKCDELPDNSIYWFGKTECKQNITYTILWNDNTMWKYLEAVKERWNWNKSAIYTQILNKQWKYIKADISWIDFFTFDLKQWLKQSYDALNK